MGEEGQEIACETAKLCGRISLNKNAIADWKVSKSIFPFYCFEAWNKQTVQHYRAEWQADIVRHRKQYMETHEHSHTAHKLDNQCNCVTVFNQ